MLRSLLALLLSLSSDCTSDSTPLGVLVSRLLVRYEFLLWCESFGSNCIAFGVSLLSVASSSQLSSCCVFLDGLLIVFCLFILCFIGVFCESGDVLVGL